MRGMMVDVSTLDYPSKRGELRIYLGAAPGVGKTYAMLSAARALKNEGLDVVVGVVETHGRSETAALLDGLEVLPRRTVAYRNRTLMEFDIDAAIARRPALLHLRTVRFLGHAGTDVESGYRSPAAIAADRGRDPLLALAAQVPGLDLVARYDEIAARITALENLEKQAAATPTTAPAPADDAWKDFGAKDDAWKKKSIYD